MVQKRKIIIKDFDENIEYKGFIKLCHCEEDNSLGYYIITECPWFEGQECCELEKEGFYYSWVLSPLFSDGSNKNILDKMKKFNDDDWRYSLPYDDTQERDWFEFLEIRLVDNIKSKNFKKMKI